MYTSDFLHSNDHEKIWLNRPGERNYCYRCFEIPYGHKAPMMIACVGRMRLVDARVLKGRRWKREFEPGDETTEREMERVGACRSRATGDSVVYLRPSRVPLTALLDVFPTNLTRRCSQTIAFPLAMKINRRHMYRVKSWGDLIDRWDSSSSTW